MVKTNNRYYVQLSGGLLILLLIAVIYDLSLGSVPISWSTIFKSIVDYDAVSSEELTVQIFRIPRVMTAILTGVSLSIAGLLMQTLFQNPLAGPYVLGINSGASLMVALSTMTGVTFFTSDVDMVTAALLGALASGLFILFCSLYVKNKVSLLLVGIMFGSFAGALVSVVQSYSSPDDLKLFMLWSFGSLQNVEMAQLPVFIAVVSVGVILTLCIIKPLNLLVLGDSSASFLGVNVKLVRFSIIFITAILTGVSTAYCGPIAFVGLIIPNITKMIYKTTNHFHLLIGTLLLGALMIVFCDIIMNLLQPILSIPLNALTALLGAPLVVWIILKRF
jgi:iron complex transport system permease protein